ncbi:MAG: DUF3800 domain-containing protein [Candidatus Burarchaeum sp.]|nr:DUF3800 domain-containing protein [Candidatus Burarchaeum sp.]MDO8339485.1 DUF3800 domain-containing protein [Candidatus Burarchaeum sp.]
MENAICLYLFVDESGDLGTHGSKYFNISALITGDPKPIQNKMKRIRERRLNKRLSSLPQIKANNSDEEIRRYVLKAINEMDCRLATIVVDKQKIRPELYDKKVRLYSYIAGILLQTMEIEECAEVSIVYEKRETNRLLSREFEEYVCGKFKEAFPQKGLQIKGLHGYEDRALQAVDFVAWAVNRKFSIGDDSYFKIIEGKTSVIPLWEK